MISVLPAHRRAEEFNAQLEGAGGSHNSRHADLLELVSAMRSVEAPAPRPDFVADLRARLMAEADVALTEVDRKLALPAHPRSHRDRRIAVLAGTAALLGATTSVAVAAQGTLPGDTLYPVKRAIEGIQSSLTFDDTARSETVLDQATGRLLEVEALARQVDSSRADQLPSTLDDFSSQAGEGADLIFTEYGETGDTDPLVELNGFVDSSMKKLVDLDALLPSTVTDSLRNATTVLTRIDDEITKLCPECAGGILQLPARLTSALGSADPGPVVTPKQKASTPGDSTPNQAIDPKDVIPLPPVGGDSTPDSPTSDPTKTITEETPKTVKKTVKAVEGTLKGGNELLLGTNGVLGPVTTTLDPLLGPILGDGGLLSD
ncbi:DUF5667 domain-containing protein [Nocardioides sp. Root140]|uniref:DUF5667 domain-containing protein n=1 Tax=Nocardioides sp. Root140 TaxID=1736460 RepID=UPI0006FB27AA|nr:DUF5667 domain-containing protein [Nocardioides sp. Root140]KQY50184.1 hypothetical protein ASD30_21930 [Nocardioides sp. Root140]